MAISSEHLAKAVAEIISTSIEKGQLSLGDEAGVQHTVATIDKIGAAILKLDGKHRHYISVGKIPE